MNRLSLLSLLGMLLGLSVHGHGEETQASFDLSPKWITGQTSQYEIKTVRVTTTQLVGTEHSQSTTMTIKATTTWEVTNAAKSGGGVATLTIDTMSAELIDPSGARRFANETGENQDLAPLVPLLKAMTGTPVEYRISPTGTIESVSGFQAIIDDAGPAGKHLTETDFQETAMELAILVGGPTDAATKTSWEHRHTWNHDMGKLDDQSTNEVVGMEMVADIPIVYVNRNADLSFQPKEMKLPPNAPPVDVTMLAGNQTTQFMFDTSRHENVGINAERSLEFQISFSIRDRSFTRRIHEVMNTQVLRISEH